MKAHYIDRKTPSLVLHIPRFNVWAWLGYILFFLMLFLSASYQPIKFVLLLLVLLIVSGKIVLHHGRIALHPIIPIWTLFMVIVGIFFTIRGWLNDAPGALHVWTVYIAWPCVFTFIIAGIGKDFFIIKALFRILVFASLAISLYAFSAILNKLGLIPDFLYIEFDQGQLIASNNIGKIYIGGFSIHSINGFPFLIPFLFTALFLWTNKIPRIVSRFWLWISLICSIIAGLLSGRTAIWVLIFLSPVMALFALLLLRPEYRKTVRKIIFKVIPLFIILVLVLGTFFIRSDVDFDPLFKRIEGKIDILHGEGQEIRRLQFIALLEGWKQYPLLGSGFGSVAPGDPKLEGKNADNLWAYELIYVALLYRTGIIGFSIYLSGVVWIYWMSLKIVRSRDHLALYVLPMIVGMTGFLIANATNPYLGLFDYMWVIFLPIALVNYWLVTSPSRKRKIELSKAT